MHGVVGASCSKAVARGLSSNSKNADHTSYPISFAVKRGSPVAKPFCHEWMTWTRASVY